MSDKTERTKEEIIADVLGWESFSPGPVMADTDDFLKAMEEYRQSSPVESKWVKVSERLPEVSTSDPWRIESSFSDDVLVFESGRRWFGYYTPKYGGSWIVPGRLGGINVTHWQELTLPPIEEPKEEMI